MQLHGFSCICKMECREADIPARIYHGYFHVHPVCCLHARPWEFKTFFCRDSNCESFLLHEFFPFTLRLSLRGFKILIRTEGEWSLRVFHINQLIAALRTIPTGTARFDKWTWVTQRTNEWRGVFRCYWQVRETREALAQIGINCGDQTRPCGYSLLWWYDGSTPQATQKHSHEKSKLYVLQQSASSQNNRLYATRISANPLKFWGT